MVNNAKAAAGRVGLVLVMPAGSGIAAGTRDIITLTFNVTGTGSTAISVTGDSPVAREVADVSANVLGASFVGGSFNLILPPGLKAAGLENLTSTRFITFMDRGPYGDFGVDSYLLGVVAKYQGLNYSLTGAVQGAPINTVDLANANADSKERITITTRGHWAPVNTDTDKLHLALSYRYRNRGDEGAFVYSGRTNTAYSNATFYTSGGIGNRDNTLAFEGAYVHGPFSVQGEYASIDVTRAGGAAVGGDPKIKVGYAYVTFWPTGEMRNYDPVVGEFKRPKILNPVTAGGWGGVELALRYDIADTTEAYETLKTRPAASQAGEYKGVTLGLNYYPTSYVRFQANYTDGDVDNFGANQDFSIKQFQLRAQLDF